MPMIRSWEARLVSWFGATLLLLALPATAERVPRHQLVWSHLTGLQYNPTGGAHFMRIGYRLRLYDDTGPLFREAYAGLGASIELSPVWFRGGLVFRVQPWSIIMAEAQVLGFQYFGVLGSAATFASPTDDYSDATRDRLDEPGQAIGGLTVRLALRLQFKYQGFALRNRARASYWLTDLGEGRSAFYSAGDDTLRPARGWVVENVLEAGYFLLDERFLVGLRYRTMAALHTGATDPNGPYHVLGPLLAWRFADNPGSLFDKSAILFHAGWYMNHRFREGPLPYFVLAFYFDGRLWSRQE